MKKIIILNGPNLNLLGEREKKQYGSFTLKDIEDNCKKYANKNNLLVSFYQSNVEGDLVTKIQESRKEFDGMIINAGAFTHTSIAIHDALKMVKIPKIEVHISNIYDREEFRKNSFISPVVNGIIAGFGTQVYQVAINSLKYL